MNDKTGRRWFQIHLSTIVVLTISAGGLLGLNIRPFERAINDADRERSSFLRHIPTEGWVVATQGWPFTFWSTYDGKYVWIGTKWRYDYLAANVAFALGILGAIAVCCEWRIRRKSREKNE